MAFCIHIEILIFCDLVEVPLRYIRIIQPVLHALVCCHLLLHLFLHFFTDGIHVVISTQIFESQLFSGQFIYRVMFVLLITAASSLIKDEFQREKSVIVCQHLAVDINILVTFFIFHTLFELVNEFVSFLFNIKIDSICRFLCLCCRIGICIPICTILHFYLRHFYIGHIPFFIHLIFSYGCDFKQISQKWNLLHGCRCCLTRIWKDQHNGQYRCCTCTCFP